MAALDRENTFKWSGDQPAHLKLALVAAIASAGDGLTHRDAAGALADLIGFLLGTDEGVPTESIEAVAESIGKVIAATAHADREAGR